MWHGIVAVWKERGMTSHDVVYKMRKILHMKKIGHTGTLDPEVEGVLPICLGDATKIASLITDSGKEYVATVSIGTATETEDQTGAIVERDDTHKVMTREQIEEVLQTLTGDIQQVPPMYSAVRVNGRRLYEYARAGIEVERPIRTVTIEQLEMMTDAQQLEGETIEFDIRIRCGKGTYIRTLAVQIGEALGYPAHMAQLKRTMSGSFREAQCVTLNELKELQERGEIAEAIQPLERALDEYPTIEVDGEYRERIEHGQVLRTVEPLKYAPYVTFTHRHKALALYMQHPTKEGLMKPFKMFPFNR